MRLSAAEFDQLMSDGVRSEQQPFRPQATYIPDGDCIEFLASPDSFSGERIDSLLTVYRNRETGEVIGSLIKGVKQFLDLHKNLLVVVVDNKVRIDHLLISHLAAANQTLGEVEVRLYQKLLRVATESGAQAELLGV